MAVKIRLKRIGRTNRPFYRICVFDSRTRRDGEPIEELGSYDPRAKTFAEKVRMDAERAAYWIGVGAQPSETVQSFLRKLGVRRGSAGSAATATGAATSAGTAAPTGEA